MPMSIASQSPRPDQTRLYCDYTVHCSTYNLQSAWSFCAYWPHTVYRFCLMHHYMAEWRCVKISYWRRWGTSSCLRLLERSFEQNISLNEHVSIQNAKINSHSVYNLQEQRYIELIIEDQHWCSNGLLNCSVAIRSASRFELFWTSYLQTLINIISFRTNGWTGWTVNSEQVGQVEHVNSDIKHKEHINNSNYNLNM